METQKLDVRVIEPRLKHPTIFNTFDSLEKGGAFIIVNDHDPKPLYYQLLAERPNQFSWEYLQSGPYEWQVKIEKPMTQSKEKSIGRIAAEDYRKALVFKKFGLDFCCGGKKTLEEAAKEKGIDKSAIQQELDLVDQETDDSKQDFINWEMSTLVDYIINRHHQYVKDRLPEINSVLHKVVNVHSEGHPELVELYQNFTWMAEDLLGHLQKEEQVLFPYIKELDKSLRNYTPENPAIKSAVRMMEEEHETAAEYLENMRKISDDYTIPPGACGSYRMVYALLNEFDEDLKQHVHLENNILFPKALKLEEELLKGTHDDCNC